MTGQTIEHKVASIFPEQRIKRHIRQLAGSFHTREQHIIAISAAGQRRCGCGLPNRLAILFEEGLAKTFSEIFFPRDKNQTMHIRLPSKNFFKQPESFSPLSSKKLF